MNDELDVWRDVLGDAEPEGDPILDDAILAATGGVIRRRRRLRRGLLVVGVLAAFGAGFATGRLGGGVGESVRPATDDTALPDAPERGSNLSDLVFLGETGSPDERIRAWRQAGDLYLAAQDFLAATRCYRRHLEAGGILDVDVSDTWLLASLKRSF